MTASRRPLFTLQEVLIVAALAALGGVSSSAVSWVGKALFVTTGLPGGLQFMAGIHVLWLVLAVGLVGKPGAGTLTGLLKGAVELLSGNPHGVLVLLMSGLGGLVVDAVWLWTGRRDRLLSYVLAGGCGAASNLLVFKVIYSLPSSRAVTLALLALAGVAFLSGALWAGLLGWSLMDALRRAGVAAAQQPAGGRSLRTRVWVCLGLVGAVVFLIGTAVFYANAGGKGAEGAARASSVEAAPVVVPAG